MLKRLWLLSLVLIGLVGTIHAQDEIDLEAIQIQALTQIEVDMGSLTDVPEGSTPEFQRDLLRNKRITAHYAELYLSDPEHMQWAGLAAYVSDEIGSQLLQMQERGLTRLFGEQYQAIVDANIAVYADIYWQHLAYYLYGLPALEEAYAEGLITESVLEAWRAIDEGAVAEGVYLIAEFEQGVVLQEALYDPYMDFFATLTATTPLESPVPNQDAPFAGSNVAIFEERWDWTVNDLLPGWAEFQLTEPEQVVIDLLTIMLNADDEALDLSVAGLVCEGDDDCANTLLEQCADDMTVECLSKQ